MDRQIIDEFKILVSWAYYIFSQVTVKKIFIFENVQRKYGGGSLNELGKMMIMVLMYNCIVAVYYTRV